MKIPYTFIYDSSPKLVSNRRPKWSKLRFPRAHSSQHYCFKEGEFSSQVANTKPFYVELLEFNNNSDLIFKYETNSSQHFLFLLLKGNVSFYTSDGFFVSYAKQGSFALTYNNKGVYEVRMDSGFHSAICIALDEEWLQYATPHLPSIRAYLNRILNGQHDHFMLPYCPMNSEIREYLNEIHSQLSNGISSFNGFLRWKISTILEKYEPLVVDKLESTPLQALDYMNKNYCNPNLTSHSIAAHFDKEERSLRDQFKKDFSITMRDYYTHLRVCYAKRLMKENDLKPMDVFLDVGYNDVKSLRYELNKFPP
jgi:AraC-like DNA-binding protein